MRGARSGVEFVPVRTNQPSDTAENEFDPDQELEDAGGFPRHSHAGRYKYAWWKQTPFVALLALVAFVATAALLLGGGSAHSRQAASSDDAAHATLIPDQQQQVLDSLVAANKMLARLQTTIHGAAGAFAPTTPTTAGAGEPSPLLTAAEAPGSPHRSAIVPGWDSELAELGTSTFYFDKYDTVEASRSDVAEDSQPRWWSKDGGKTAADSAHSVGLFGYSDVSHPRFLSTPEAYAKYNRKLEYDPEAFRAAPVPIVWGDEWGFPHWNAEAERQFYHLLRAQQQPLTQVPCSQRKFIVVEQWKHGGFFSRFHEATQLIRRALLTDREFILDPLSMGGDDHLVEGINHYFLPLSQCSADPWFLARAHNHQERNKWRPWDQHGQIYPGGDRFDDQIVWMDHQRKDLRDWRSPRYHIPHRKHLFQYGEGVKHPQRYKDSQTMLNDRTQHEHEHVYPHPTSKAFRQSAWDTYENDVSAEDRITLYFSWHMLVMWQWAPLPRIQAGTAALRQHWAARLMDEKYMRSQPQAATAALYPQALADSAAIIVRRGDKGGEDGYYQKKGHFRDLSLFGWPLRNHVQAAKKHFTSLFFMSDDAPLVEELRACTKARGPEPFTTDIPKSGDAPDPRGAVSRRGGCRTEVSEIAFGGLPLIYNVNSLKSSSDQSGIEQLLISVHFIVQHSSYCVAHTDSNIGRTIEELMYGTRQLDPSIKTVYSVFESAVDDYGGSLSDGYHQPA